MCLFQCANRLSSRRGWLTFYLYLSIHCLYAQPNAEALSSQTVTTHQGSMTTKQRWQGWYYSSELGVHFSTFKDVDWQALKVKTEYGAADDSSAFWGQFGVLSSPYGFQYTRIFKERFFWRFKCVWTLFYPDVRWKGGKQPITLSSIPFIGKYLSFGQVSGWLTMFLTPMTYFGVGYVNKSNVAFSLESVYLWGVVPGITVPLTKRLFLENKFVFFLDKYFKKGWFGFHNCYLTIGLNYKF